MKHPRLRIRKPTRAFRLWKAAEIARLRDLMLQGLSYESQRQALGRSMIDLKRKAGELGIAKWMTQP